MVNKCSASWKSIQYSSRKQPRTCWREEENSDEAPTSPPRGYKEDCVCQLHGSMQDVRFQELCSIISLIEFCFFGLLIKVYMYVRIRQFINLGNINVT